MLKELLLARWRFKPLLKQRQLIDWPNLSIILRIELNHFAAGLLFASTQSSQK
jgi:hypothetical protein